MSGIAAIAPTHGAPDARGSPPLASLAARGSRERVAAVPGCALGAVHDAWEQAPVAEGVGRGGEPLVVVADAALFHRADLARALAAAGEATSARATSAELILAAYRAWGGRCAERLEGDFAFAVWDSARRTLTCARDFGGRRPLFVAQRAGGIAVASTVGALLALRSAPPDLDRGALTAAAAGLFAHPGTAYQGIAPVPAGSTLVWREGRTTTTRHWDPPPVESRGFVAGVSLAEGAEELRALLADAVRERLDAARPTAVWMSGGWDSTAVFAAGMADAEARGAPGALHPVSMSYPEGDPGREDHWIRAVADRWRAQVNWLDVSAIPMLSDAAERAALRDEPFGHPYENWNRALARGARAVGAHIALDGVGGDQLFQVSYVYLAELLRRGRVLSLVRELRAKGLRGREQIFHWAFLPLLPASLRRLAGRRLGAERVRSYLERPVPPWIREEALTRCGVREAERANTPQRRGASPVAYETTWYLTHPYGAKVLAAVASFAREEGVELRSPLHDGRVVHFAASRPWSERTWDRETKRLLRAAMRGLLPEEVLAPRRSRTGITSGYLDRSLRAEFAPLVAEVLQTSVLEQLGMVDADRLRKAWQEYLHSGDENLAVSLFFTLQTELWTRARMAE